MAVLHVGYAKIRQSRCGTSKYTPKCYSGLDICHFTKFVDRKLAQSCRVEKGVRNRVPQGFAFQLGLAVQFLRLRDLAPQFLDPRDDTPLIGHFRHWDDCLQECLWTYRGV